MTLVAKRLTNITVRTDTPCSAVYLRQRSCLFIHVTIKKVLNVLFLFHNTFTSLEIISFPRCMECQRGLAMRKVSVCLSVRPSVCQTRPL